MRCTLIDIYHDTNGIALVTVMALMALLFMLGTALLNNTTTEYKISQNHKRSIQAFYDCEAGIAEGIARIKNKTAVLDQDGDPNWISAADPNLFQYRYCVIDPNYIDPNEHIYKIISKGMDPTQTASQGITVELQANNASPFFCSCFGDEGVDIQNGDTDSYDSRLGNYGGGNINQRGDVGTNATSAGCLSVSPNGKVRGNVQVGPGANLATAISNQGTITGTTSTMAEQVAMPSVSVPAGAIDLGDIKSDLSLTPGVYVCDSIQLSGQKTLTTTGDVRIYVRNSVNTAGQAQLGTGNPSNLIIFGLDTCTSFALSGCAEFRACVYAPKADVTLNGLGGSNGAFGSIIAKKINFHGNRSSFHYDESLADLGLDDFANYEIISWREE